MNPWLFFGSLFSFLSVAFGAFGAHGLSQVLDAKDLSTFQTAVHYQFLHALALLALGIWNQALTRWIGSAFLLGILFFSGSLYAWIFSKLHFFVFITPIGGLSFMVGWLLWMISLWKFAKRPSKS